MLAGKAVVIGITGGVAAHYLPELIGQLHSRHLATVYAIMTPAAAHTDEILHFSPTCRRNNVTFSP